ncbi:MAG: hypothetical protein AAF772_12475, partial [Acidobacteriota bacterium]
MLDGDDLFDEEEDGEFAEAFDDEEEDDLGLFDAAYEGVTFEDSADDTRLELEDEAKRLASRLAFLQTVARLWKHAAVAWGVRGVGPD